MTQKAADLRHHWKCCIPEIWTGHLFQTTNGRYLQPSAERKNHGFGCYKFMFLKFCLLTARWWPCNGHHNSHA